MLRKPNCLWVVEMYEEGHWLPTLGTSLSRDEGRRQLGVWRESCLSDCFRLRRYYAEED